ncbi:unnamed protein product [Notodromas monacha]|uniref:GDT1 family protein n=1 Tax=Notodromas monacha TaxID=399045 RepID=A0A7R9C0C6_9CRUS|nr:unnamed protein product [Notodromas monacha]CAG0923854.1 unnamed protein product [Notodromas monacha]
MSLWVKDSPYRVVEAMAAGGALKVSLWICILLFLKIDPLEAEKSLRSDGPGAPSVVQPVAQPALANVTANHSSSVKHATNKGFMHAFVAALSIVVVSEIGDKTFFIAAIMAMRHPRSTVFLAALGYAVTVIPKKYTLYISSGLFAIFGIKMLVEGMKMKPGEGQEELEEVQSDLRRREEAEKSPDLLEAPTVSSRSQRFIKMTVSVWKSIARVFLQAFTMTFLAEWGDRSQISTIVLAATENVWGVTLGGTVGHSLCTGVAVIGGRIVAQRISVKTVTLIGGVVFLLFAVSSLFVGA